MGFEYKVVEMETWTVDYRIRVEVEKMIQEHAKEGWRLAQTIVREGWTVGYIFERHQ